METYFFLLSLVLILIGYCVVIRDYVLCLRCSEQNRELFVHIEKYLLSVIVCIFLCITYVFSGGAWLSALALPGASAIGFFALIIATWKNKVPYDVDGYDAILMASLVGSSILWFGYGSSVALYSFIIVYLFDCSRQFRVALKSPHRVSVISFGLLVGASIMVLVVLSVSLEDFSLSTLIEPVFILPLAFSLSGILTLILKYVSRPRGVFAR
ncbi:MAG: hypothetical protein ACI83D_000013 [Planctomycetota bacterium]|jgi:hypothetical protein